MPVGGQGVTISFAERFAASDQFDAIFKEGMGLVEKTASYLDGQGRKEARALQSVRRFAAARGRTAEYLSKLDKVFEDAMEADLTDLERAYGAIAGRNPPNVDLSAEEKAMAQLNRVRIAD